MKVACRSVHQRDLLDHETEGDDGVGGGNRLAVLEIDLVLPGRHLVVGGLDLETHRLEHQGDVASRFLAEVSGAEVEVPAGVVGGWDGVAV